MVARMKPRGCEETGWASRNVRCKVSGLVTEAVHHAWDFETLLPYLAVVEPAFGRNRQLWGSDWPGFLLAAEQEALVKGAQEWNKCVAGSRRLNNMSLHT